MQNFLISAELLQAVGNYLISRPYREVAGLVDAIQSLPQEPARATEERGETIKKK